LAHWTCQMPPIPEKARRKKNLGGEENPAVPGGKVSKKRGGTQPLISLKIERVEMNENGTPRKISTPNTFSIKKRPTSFYPTQANHPSDSKKKKKGKQFQKRGLLGVKGGGSLLLGKGKLIGMGKKKKTAQQKTSPVKMTDGKVHLAKKGGLKQVTTKEIRDGNSSKCGLRNTVFCN